MRRCFVSIDMPAEVIEKIKSIQKRLPEFRGKFTEPANLHLTLKFLGEIDEEAIKEVKERLAGIKFSPLDLEITDIGVFTERFVRIVWLKVKGAEEIQKKVDEALSDMFGSEQRFMSHLTIARIKRIKDRSEFLEKLNGLLIPSIKFVANSFNLKESILKPSGLVYTLLEKYA